jgi:hypothetical protein
MTAIDSYAFLLLGAVMQIVPAIAPQHFPPEGIVGTNGSALWLQFMGWVNYLLGAAFVAQLQILPGLKRLAQWSQTSWDQAIPTELFRPTVRLELWLQFQGDFGCCVFL